MPNRRLSPEERLLRTPKHLNLSIEEIISQMTLNLGDLEAPLRAGRIRGHVRIVIRCRHLSPTSWSMSIILNSSRFDGRIDGIDWEGLFVSTDGTRHSGFHRHDWDAKVMSCERRKIPLTEFKPSSMEQFVIQGLALLGVILRKEPNSHGSQMSIT
jgi:hypothetical protein